MRWLLVLVMVVHGLIHLLGVPLIWGGTVAGMTGEMLVPLTGFALRAGGVAWLVACVMLLVAACGVAYRRAWWRPFALAGVALSQALVVVWWQDARAGSLANLIVLAAIIWRARATGSEIRFAGARL